jgi:hypothetical protein
MVLEQGGDYAWQWATIGSIAAKIGFCVRLGSVYEDIHCGA